MHEMALCESLLRILEEQAAEQGYQRVTRVQLEVGALSCVEKEALRFSFSAVTRSSLAEGAALELVDRSGQAWCFPCGCSVTLDSLLDDCPRCGSGQLQVSAGQELQIKELEVA